MRYDTQENAPPNALTKFIIKIKFEIRSSKYQYLKYVYKFLTDHQESFRESMHDFTWGWGLYYITIQKDFILYNKVNILTLNWMKYGG